MKSAQMKILCVSILIRHFIWDEGVQGTIIRKPDNVTILFGKEVKFVCHSDVTIGKIQWHRAAARQTIAEPINEGFLEESNNKHINVSETIVNNVRQNTLTIKNISMTDAGTYVCMDDDSFGDTTFATLSVYKDKLDEQTCKTACTGSELVLSCSFCYWSHNNLSTRWTVNESQFIMESQSQEMQNRDNSCLEHKSYAILPYQCSERTICMSRLSVKLCDHEANALSVSYSLTAAPCHIYREEISHTQTTQNTESNGSSIDEGKKSVLITAYIVVLCVTVSIIVGVVGLSVGMILQRTKYRRINSARNPEKKHECTHSTSSGMDGDQKGISHNTKSNTALLSVPQIKRCCRQSSTSSSSGSVRTSSTDCEEHVSSLTPPSICENITTQSSPIERTMDAIIRIITARDAGGNIAGENFSSKSRDTDAVELVRNDPAPSESTDAFKSEVVQVSAADSAEILKKISDLVYGYLKDKIQICSEKGKVHTGSPGKSLENPRRHGGPDF